VELTEVPGALAAREIGGPVAVVARDVRVDLLPQPASTRTAIVAARRLRLTRRW
jgi:hypothetical protein